MFIVFFKPLMNDHMKIIFVKNVLHDITIEQIKNLKPRKSIEAYIIKIIIN